MERETSALVTGAEATASCPQVLAIPDAQIVMVETAPSLLRPTA